MKKSLITWVLTLVLLSLLSGAALGAEYGSPEPLAETAPASDGAMTGIPLDETAFPDSVFRAFVASYDTDGSGDLSREERNAVGTMNCENMGISDLTGIEHFTRLTELLCGMNELRRLDISALKNLDWLAVNQNELTELILPAGGVLLRLDCSDNALTSLELGGLAELMQLHCHGNGLTRLDISGNPALLSRMEYASPVTEEGIVCHIQPGNFYPLVLTYDEGVALVGAGAPLNGETFPDDIFRAFVKSAFDTNGNGYLSPGETEGITTLNCQGLGIADLTGVEHFPELTTLLCGMNALTELDVSMLFRLERLGANGNELASLTLPEGGMLLRLDCSDNALTELDISDQTGLEQLACHGNEFSFLDISANGAFLERLRTIDPITEEGIVCWLVPGPVYAMTMTCDETVTIEPLRMRRGDVTGEGLVTAEDAGEILKYMTGQESVFGSTVDGAWEYARRAAADALVDTVIDVRDAAQILRYAAGYPSTLG